MHRSGTSALARVMNLLGPPMPEPLLLGMPDNPLGHWEPLELLDLNTKALAAAGGSWDVGPFEAAARTIADTPSLRRAATSFLCRCYSRGNRTALLKDPRQTVTLPSWLELAEALGIGVRIAFIFRNPVEVAQSLKTRDGIGLEAGLELWMLYNRLGEAYSRGVPRIFVDYDRLRRSPEEVIGDLLTFMDGNGAFDEAAVHAVAREGSSHRAPDAWAAAAPADVAKAYASLQAAAARSDGACALS